MKWVKGSLWALAGLALLLTMALKPIARFPIKPDHN